MSSDSLDTIQLGNDTGFHEIKNGQNFTDYGTVVATEEALYGAEGAADYDDFVPHQGEDEAVNVGGSRKQNGWGTGHPKDPDSINTILENLGSKKRVNPEGEVFEPGWRKDLAEDYFDDAESQEYEPGSDPVVERAIDRFEEENGF